MRFGLALAAVALAGSFGMAHADTLNTFNLSAVLTTGSASGTVTLDETTGKFTAANITVMASGASAVFTGAPIAQTTATGLSSNVFATSTLPLISFDLALPIASLIGYSGGSLCTITASCATDATGVQLVNAADLTDATSGTLTLVPATGVTPEPSSLLLLATGVFVLGGIMKRRRA